MKLEICSFEQEMIEEIDRRRRRLITSVIPTCGMKISFNRGVLVANESASQFLVPSDYWVTIFRRARTFC